MAAPATRSVLLLFALLLLVVTASIADNLPKDAWLWSTVTLEKKLNKKWSLSAEEELRLNNNWSDINLFFTNIGGSYRPAKFLKLSLVYRFINKYQPDQAYSKRHRLYFDAAVKKKFGKVTAGYRFRIQGQVRDYYSSPEGHAVESYIRNKFEADYDLGKWEPFLAAEFRIQLNHPKFHDGDGRFNRSRWYAGCNYSPDKKHTYSLYYMIQHDFNNLRAMNAYTLGIQYAYSF